MADDRDKLEAQLLEARALREKHAQALDEILELLSKADARRKIEPGNVRRWDQVLDHLEASLVQVRARINASQHQLNVARRALQEVLGAEALRAVEAAHESSDVPAERRSFEDRLEKVIGAENAAAALNADQVDHPPLTSGSADTSDPPASSQQALQSAIEKIQTHRVHALNAEEVKATAAAYDRLSRLPSPNLRDQRLMRILSAAVKIFQRTTRRKQ